MVSFFQGVFSILVLNLLIESADAATCEELGLSLGLQPDPANCANYIECSSDGSVRTEPCPFSTVFNPLINNCDNPDRVPDCVGTTTKRTTPTTTTTTTTTTMTTTTTKRTTRRPDASEYCSRRRVADGIHPHPYDCHKFIMCSFGNTSIFPCNAGLVYNTKIKGCDYKYNVKTKRCR